ncbi:FAD-dependent oxidoreductase [Bifidobacterium criceti]|uniref:Thioredoxin reductase n=1 Tax=Bifidobacterium criceti TaxID=1960969 RepID=A0A2A2EER1_9BIFI|nr:FAD-dependent oxidoreductase [Bifidobacterium criceti]PAU67415.1 thioredoxin reductase [Bifidobacterium criceti]
MPIPQDDFHDAVVIGGGPAGLTAAMYLARARYRTLLVEKDDFGGQITITDDVVNYPGVLTTNGRKLTAVMRRQAQDFGAELRVADVTGIDVLDDGVKVVHTTRGDVRTFAVVLAMGASPRKVGFAGEREYAGRGVAYCATCDGEFFTGRDVLVVGGGFAAAEESVFLTRYARKVTVLVREDDFTCDASVAAHTKANPKIDIMYGTELKGVEAGERGLVAATLRDAHTGERRRWQPDDDGTFGVFVFAGYVPQTSIVDGVVPLDDHGYVLCDPMTLETTVPGIYAAGDLRVKDLRQVVTATADGAIAAVHAEQYAAEASKRTGIVPKRPTDTVYERDARDARTSAPAQTSIAPVSNDVEDTPAASVHAIFDDDVRAQLTMVFSRMARPVTLQLQLDDTPLSVELDAFIDELVSLSDGKLGKVADHVGRIDEHGRGAFDASQPLPFAAPVVSVLVRNDDGELIPTGISFHGVPSGHEFNSFVLGIYNAAGPGQPLTDDERARIEEIHEPVDIMLLVSLTCTMCPETVRAAQRIAALNPNVRAEAYDIAHYPELKERYDVMSVPCIVLTRAGERHIDFGRKSVAQMLDLIEQQH